jgi:hypothetical protein
LDNITAGQWFADNQFPPAFLDQYNVISRGRFGSNLDEISALSLIAEIGGDFVDFKPIQTADSLTNSATTGQYKTNKYVFADNDQTIKTITEYFGDRVHVFSNVLEVTREGNRFLVVYEDKEKQRHVEAARAVILAVPAFIANSMASSILSQEQVDLLQQVPYRSYVTVQLYSETPIINQAFRFIAPAGLLFTDVYDDLWGYRATDPSFTAEMVTATVIVSPQSHNDESFFDIGEDEMYNRLFSEMDPFFAGVQEKALGYVSYNLSNIDPIMNLGAYHRLARLHETMRDGLILSGDYTIFPDFEGMVNSGYVAAQRAKEFLQQDSSVLYSDRYR